MFRLFPFVLSAIVFFSEALLSSAQAANVLHLYNSRGVPAYPPPSTYAGNPFDFAGDQTFSDADGWSFSFQPGRLPEFLVTRPDLSQQGYYGQYGDFSPPFAAGANLLSVGDYVGDHNHPVCDIDGRSEDLTRLQILGVAYDPTTGAVTSLAADFVEADPSAPGEVLYGQFRFNSDVSLGAGHPYLLFDKATYAASESDDGVTINVVREGGTADPVNINYAVSGGTATADLDYLPVSGTLAWAAGDNAPKVIYLPILKNNLLEGERTIILSLTGDNLGATTQTIVTLATDPLPPSLLHFRYFGFRAQDTTQTSAQGFTFVNPLSSPPSTDIMVQNDPSGGSWQVEDLSLAGGDRLQVGSYNAGKSGGFEFNGPIALENVGSEDWQILEVNYGVDGALLQLAMNFEVLDTEGQPLLRGEIRFHSTLPLRGTVGLTAAAFAGSRSAGTVRLTAQRQGDLSDPISFKYATADYSAVKNVDYVATKGTLRWAAGEAGMKTFTVPLLPSPVSGDRVFFVDLKGSSLGDNTNAAVTIVDDHLPPAVSLPEPTGQIDATYPALVSNSAEVYIGVICPLANGGALVGGNFAIVGGQKQPGILRLDSSGTPDFSFTSPLMLSVEPEVKAIAIQTDGKALVAGHFAVTATAKTVSLVRLDTDGRLDPGFQMDTQIGNGTIYSIALQPDGRLLIAGDFTVGSGLARLNADGSLDASFTAPTLDYSDSYFLVLLQADGKVLAIDTYDSLKRYNADGSVDDTYTAYDGPFTTNPNALALQSDGKLVVLRSNAGGLVRLNRDGTEDTNFDQASMSNLGFSVGSLALQPDGKLLVGGSFPSNVGSAHAALARLNPDGSLDNSFVASASLPSAIGAMARETGGSLLVSAGHLSMNGKDVVHTVFAKLISTSQGPVVSLTASVAEAGGAEGQSGEFLLKIPAALSTNLKVAYRVKGSGINGTDYTYLSGIAKIKAGTTSKTIKVVPQGSLGGAASKTVKLVLAPGAGYAISTMNGAKVRINASSH